MPRYKSHGAGNWEKLDSSPSSASVSQPEPPKQSVKQQKSEEKIKIFSKSPKSSKKSKK